MHSPAHSIRHRHTPRRPFPLALCLVAIVLSSIEAAAFGAELVQAKDGSGYFGYKDTPKLPWCEWLVHDPDRPAPPRVEPGRAGAPVDPPADAIVLFGGKDLAA